MKNKFQFLLFCFIVIGFSSCIPAIARVQEPNKAQDFTEKPKKILIYFDSGTPIASRVFRHLEENLVELISLSNVEVVAVPYKMTALDGEGDLAQKIASVAPDVLLKISYVPPILDGGPLVFDVKMLAPDQKKIQWRGMLTSTFTISERWARKSAKKLVVQLRKDGILD
ncbi:MAG: hypothetical protein RIR11_2928 [Bacteroidota bacterium]|jgi:hypothetical protein